MGGEVTDVDDRTDEELVEEVRMGDLTGQDAHDALYELASRLQRRTAHLAAALREVRRLQDEVDRLRSLVELWEQQGPPPGARTMTPGDGEPSRWGGLCHGCNGEGTDAEWCLCKACGGVGVTPGDMGEE